MGAEMYDALYRGGKVITVNRHEDIVDWVAVKDGKIAALGKADDEPRASETVELDGAVLLPGLYDAHCHIMPTGMFMASANLLKAKSIGETLALIEAKCASASDGEWVFGSGFSLYGIKEGRLPNRHELDSVSGDRPVMVHALSLHGGALNSAALKLVNVPDVVGVGRDADGLLDGVLLSDDSYFTVAAQVMGLLPEAKLKRFITDCADYAVTKGVTSIVGLIGSFVTDDKDVDMLAQMKLIASMQPAFSGLWDAIYPSLGAERAYRMEVFPEIIRRGGIICGGSDSPVTGIDPLFGIACCIDNPDPRRNVSVHDALKIFTRNAAYSVHEEKRKGSVEIGKDADFTIVDRNPYDCAGRDEIYGMKAIMTVKDAKVTFRA
jgi:predicted amidohydrolase YtcJ